MTPRDWFRNRFGCAALMGMVIVFALAVWFYFHNPVLAGAILVAAALLRVFGTWRQPTMRLMVSPGGVGWVHPERGPGMIVWQDIGALIVRQAGSRGELALYLVPREAPEGRTTNAFMMTTGDLGLESREGEARLKAFVEEILPRLPRDLVLDRETRGRFAAWGVSWTPR
ncbi:MAG: hypothetical protein AAB152_17945 [Candidatus Coatesbacteria bacterium]